MTITYCNAIMVEKNGLFVFPEVEFASTFSNGHAWAPLTLTELFDNIEDVTRLCTGALSATECRWEDDGGAA